MSQTPIDDTNPNLERAENEVTDHEVAEPEVYYSYPGPRQPQPKQGGIGCWLVGMLTLLIATALIIGGLFLPPISLGERLFEDDSFAVFDPQAAAPGSLLAVEESGLTILVNPADAGNEFGVALSSEPREALVNGSAGTWLQEASAARPVYLVPQSPAYAIETTGTAPNALSLTIAIPPNSAAPDVLDLYAWNSTRKQWVFVPSHPTTDGGFVRADLEQLPQYLALFQTTPINADGKPSTLTVLDTGDQINPDVLAMLDIVSPTGRQPALIPATNGQPARATLVGLLAPGFQTNSSYAVMPVVRNFSDPRATDVDTVTAIISDPALRSQHAQQLTDFASAGSYQGLFIDYRDLPEDQKENFSEFIRVLADRLHSVNIELGVVVPAAEGVVVSADTTEATAGNWRTGAYDWRAIGRYADYVQINFALNPRLFTPGSGQLVEEMMRWAVGEISRYKILGGLSTRSVQERQGNFTPIGFDEAISPLGNVELEAERSETGSILPGSDIRLGLDGFDAIPGVEDTIQSPFIIYNDESGSEATRMWLTTAEALQFRMSLLNSFGIRGIAFSDLLNGGVIDGLAQSLEDFEPNAALAQLVLNWRIESAAGQVTEFTTRLNEEIVVTLQAQDGNYAVNVDVVSGDASSSRGGAEVALALPTATPTPRPTSTPTPTPSPTPTLAPVQQAPSNSGGNAPSGSNNVPVTRPGAGSIGALEIGGHVTSAGSSRAHNAMRSAGMNWMKVQLRFSPGADVGAAADAINNARAAGFKILLGIVGSPGELAAGGGDYIRQYGEFVGRVAALGPDAIEIWNEPNLAREWPEGQISGGNYTLLLQTAYNAIKSTNGGVLVISAAMAPTGAEAAFPGQVVNDDNFIRQMVEAGALNYMDCLGMHYNEGTVSAYATSGDFRDNYYTRYLPTMLNYYWSLIGGQRPICITELGYLTSEGYGPLPGFFAWASDNTVAEQAAWLAEAAAFSSQSGKVRLMIVWNVDFQNYGADPMAGFAMIRADGSCPACTALAGAR